ncbi:MAG TPA: kynureninase [Candidatus Marinimicrobia bacterium]|nr:kynureninase [Candidatus Neomarinimicrobiota bacterium]HIA85840.1 kynureninase [Candidatus Neomarinimicrobiota bacterium]
MNYEASLSFAEQMDQNDPLKDYRRMFHFHRMGGKEVIYFCGNSLGLMSKTTTEMVNKELEVWAKKGVIGQHTYWEPYHEHLSKSTARLVGAKPSEVVVMNALTVNLHLLLISFYQPTGNRNKIVIEKGAFPSDQYAVESQIKLHGLNPKDVLLELSPREGEKTLHTEDILETLKEHGDSIATILIGGVNYYTGQAFDMEAITKAGQKIGAYVGFDLAHAAGNIMLDLHDWGVDFAAWCSYKYLCAGPGSPGGVFIHERHGNWDGPRLSGWWGHDKQTRFQMGPDFVPIKGAEGWQISNAPILAMACLRASMAIFDKVGMSLIRSKSEKLTGYMEFLMNTISNKVEIVTPADATQRGSQLSLVMNKNGKDVFNQLGLQGVICDWREPDVIRVAPVPLYNSFIEVYRFYEILKSLAV